MFERVVYLIAGILITVIFMSGTAERQYNLGYNKATLETVIQCGTAVHVLIDNKCPEIYEQLMHVDKPGYAQEVIKELEKRKEIYLKQINQLKGENHL